MTPKPDLKQSLSWLVFASLIGFLVPAVFSSVLRWERSLFLIPYVAVVGTFLFPLFSTHADLTKAANRSLALRTHRSSGSDFLLMRNIQGQPASAMLEGGQLILALAWIGLVYGVIDGLLLNVMPVLAVQGPRFYESSPSRKARLVRGFIALAASVVVTVAYHSGYTEFHGT